MKGCEAIPTTKVAMQGEVGGSMRRLHLRGTPMTEEY